LKRWNDNKGFGFISPEDGNPDIFIHISALKSMSRRPVIGDVICFQLQIDNNGKSKACNAMIEGAPRVKQKTEKNRIKVNIDNSWISRFICILICLTISSVLIIRFVQNRSVLQPASSMSTPATHPTTPVSATDTDQILERAYNNQQSDIQVQGKGSVIKILSDDVDGARHQRFILRLNNGQTVLVAHNIDLAPRLSSLSMGDYVEFFGEYEWNSKGGVIHWTHHDPNGQHDAGWLKHGGSKYQ